MGEGEGARWLARRLGLPLGALLGLLLAGTLGYVAIEGWSFDDTLFMAATTITTVGFGEVRPLSPAGRVLTMLLIAVGLALLWYGLSVLVAIVAGGELGRQWGRTRMERRLAGLRGHYVVCGFGRVGREIAEQLARDGLTVAVVDHDAGACAAALAAGFLAIEGDTTGDETLQRARVGAASGLITAVATDADNVFVVLSARALAADLPIVARANHDQAIAKLYRAGASQVVSPYDMAGRQMARLARRPATVAFVENLFRGDGGPLLEAVCLSAQSPLLGRSIAEARRLLPDLSLVALRRGSETTVPPPTDLVLQAGDVIAAIGEPGLLCRLEQASAGPDGVAPGNRSGAA